MPLYRGDGDGADIDHSIHQRRVVIGWQTNISGNFRSGFDFFCVAFAVCSSVGVVGFSGHTAGMDGVIETKPDDGIVNI